MFLSRCVLLLFVLTLSAPFFSQSNLVPNPSFEDTVYCPNGTNQIDAALGWINFGNSPDYYNACAPASLNIPNAQGGVQYANSGQGMAGVVTYVWQFAPGWPNYREYIGGQLLNPLMIGQKYYISFFLNFTGYLQGWQKIGADKIGVRFSTIAFSEFTPAPLNNFAHLYTDSIYIDTIQWYKISGSFIADSAYNYVILGNFFDSAQTDTLIFGGPPFGGSLSYYYVDDVCVTTDSLYNATWTGLVEPDANTSLVTIFPNPSDDILNIHTMSGINEIEIINCLGQIVYYKKMHGETDIALSISNIMTGINFISIKTKNDRFKSLFKIIH